MNGLFINSHFDVVSVRRPFVYFSLALFFGFAFFSERWIDYLGISEGLWLQLT